VRTFSGAVPSRKNGEAPIVGTRPSKDAGGKAMNRDDAPIGAECASRAARLHSLLELTQKIVEQRSLAELLEQLAPRLNAVAGTGRIALTLLGPDASKGKVHVLAGEEATGGESPLDEAPGGEVFEKQEPRYVTSKGRSLAILPLTTPREKLGIITFARAEPGLPTEDDKEIFQLVTKHLAVAFENSCRQQEAESLRKELADERDRLRLLLQVADAVGTELDLRALMRSIGTALRKFLSHEWTDLALYESETGLLRVHTVVGNAAVAEGRTVPAKATAPGKAILERTTVVSNTQAELLALANDEEKTLVRKGGLHASCFLPLLSRGRVLGTLNFASTREGTFDPATVQLLTQIASHIAPAVDNALAYERLDALKEQLKREKVYLEDEIRTEGNFDEIVGKSKALKAVLSSVETVAATDSTVLVQGETGTGKELVARAIHNLSSRRDKTFVKLNCAAIPTGLLESELFGHEKGAFTGAVSQKAGRFELAHKGTLFLDEIGEISQELQPKLLRVLQDQEFERLGGTKTIKVDVRLIAATNRDLSQMVAARTFRSDLFYRLNVFPVSVPALRERDGDVPILVRHFVEQLSRRMGKKIDTIPKEAMEALTAYHWPGNVRELENLIERSVILTKGNVLQVSLPELRAAPAPISQPAPGNTSAAAGDKATPSSPLSVVDETERALITKTLEECGWRVGGAKGAAAKLGVSRTTLQSKMVRLGIARPG
jgi:formate hydrogenlyase transcriptional activator